MGQRRLGLVAVTLLLSAVIHGLILALPGWSLPDLAESAPEEPLAATLVTTPRPALAAPRSAVPVAPPKPVRRPPRPKPSAVEAAGATAALPPPAAEAAPAESPPAEPPGGPAEPPGDAAGPPQATPAASPPEPEPAPLPPGAPTWPRQGRIVYDVFRGDKDFLVGRTVHRWEQDGQRYRMEAVVETIGLAALMKSFHYVQRSEGRVTPRGLMPDSFRVEQQGRHPGGTGGGGGGWPRLAGGPCDRPPLAGARLGWEPVPGHLAG